MPPDPPAENAFQDVRARQLEEALLELARLREQTRQELARALAERDEALAQGVAAVRQREQALGERNVAIAQRDAVAQALADVLASPSWRATAGLRAVKGLIRRESRGGRS